MPAAMSVEAPVTYGRVDGKTVTPADGFEHLNNFLLLNGGNQVMVKAITPQEALTSNLVQCSRVPLSLTCRCYSVTLKSIEEGQFVMVGLTNKCLPGFPVWTIDRSVRYHSNDGGVFNGGMGFKTYMPYGEGDTITCRLDYVGPDRSLINFLLNKRFVYRQWVNLPPDQLYATIGVSRANCHLSVVWPGERARDVMIRSDLTSNWFGWKGITRDDDGMTFALDDLDPRVKRDAYNVQSPLAFTKDWNYVEISLERQGNLKSGQGLGLVSGHCEAFVYPGWTINTIGYHTDDGGLYVNGEKPDAASKKENACQPGDRIGVGVIFPPEVNPAEEREPVLLLVYFTRNGQLAYTRRMRQPRGGFFPCIALSAQSDKVRLTHKPSPPELDLDLPTLLTTPEASADYRCTELMTLSDVTANGATVTMTSSCDTAQLLQYRAEPLRNLGDSFKIEVTKCGPDTEIQMGISTEGAPLEGEFLGAQPTSCGYMLRLGSIVSMDGMRPAAKLDPEKKQTIACYLDYADDAGAVVCFTLRGKLIGRGVVARADGWSKALYATVVLSAGPAQVKCDWTGVLNSTKIDRTWSRAEEWLRPGCVESKGNILSLKPSDGYNFAANAQCPLPLVTGSSVFSVRLMAGDVMAGVGLTRATHDVNNVLGSEQGEVAFLPSTQEILANNVKRHVKGCPETGEGDVIQVGVVFSKASDRAQQKVVVFLAINKVIITHARLQANFGGLYPTVSFGAAGGSAEVVPGKTVLPVPDHVCRAWMMEQTQDDWMWEAAFSLQGERRISLTDRRISLLPEIESFTPRPNTEIKVYASHAFSDRERVEHVIKQLEKRQPCVATETSTSRACMADKNNALAAADLVLLFVSNAYFRSHEMLTEYTQVIRDRGLLAVLCALDHKSWPPHTYFAELEGELSKLPWVEMTLNDKGGLPSIKSLERFVEKTLREKFKGQAGDTEEDDIALPPQVRQQASHPSAGGSKTCHIL